MLSLVTSILLMLITKIFVMASGSEDSTENRTETTQLLQCENCGNPKPATITDAGPVPIGKDYCQNCGGSNFTPVTSSDIGTEQD